MACTSRYTAYVLCRVLCVVYARMCQQSTQHLLQEKVEEWLQTIKALIQKDMRTNPTLDFETGSFILAADMPLHQSTPISEFIFYLCVILMRTCACFSVCPCV